MYHKVELIGNLLAIQWQLICRQYNWLKPQKPMGQRQKFLGAKEKETYSVNIKTLLL